MSDARLRELERRWKAGDAGAAWELAQALDRLERWDEAEEVLAVIPHLPPNWRQLVDLPRGARFIPERDPEYRWGVRDLAYDKVLTGFDLHQARDVARFAQEYVDRHGDIDLNAFPYEIDQPLRYDLPRNVIRYWDWQRSRYRPSSETNPGCGDCYRWAFQYLQRQLDNPRLKLVHGTVHPEWHGQRFYHAWVELSGSRVKDWQSHSGEGPGWHGKQLRKSIPLKKFYEKMKPEDIRKYSFEEAMKAVSKERRATGRFHFGPWGEDG